MAAKYLGVPIEGRSVLDMGQVWMERVIISRNAELEAEDEREARSRQAQEQPPQGGGVT